MTRYEPTDEARRAVEEMASFGMPQRRIAAALGISEDILRTYYRHELDEGVAMAAVDVRRSLWQLATGWVDPADGKKYKPDSYAARVWLETHGLSAAKVAEAKEKKAVADATADLRALSLDDLLTLERILNPKRGVVVDVSGAVVGTDPAGGRAAAGAPAALASARAPEDDLRAPAPSASRRRTRTG